MSLSRAVSGACICVAALILAASCSTQNDSEPDVPSPPGAVQPASGGALLAEAAACSQLKSAESSARERLGCAASMRDCPSFIRPAGGTGCFQYSKASIDGCSTLYAGFTECTDFDKHPCLISATECAVESSGEGGAGGAAGAAGAATLAGEAGSAGAAGAAGAGSASAGAGGV